MLKADNDNHAICLIMPAESAGWYWEVVNAQDKQVLRRGLAETKEEAVRQGEEARLMAMANPSPAADN